jgi:hypothetical protein
MTANLVTFEGNLVTKVVNNSAFSCITTALFPSRDLGGNRATL